jgi:uncharacterized protein (DUF1499 family)
MIAGRTLASPTVCRRAVSTRATAKRRESLFALMSLIGGQRLVLGANAEEISSPGSKCDGPDCSGVAGEVGNETLNTCSLSKPSCVSTLNDDELHFIAPWEYDSTTEEAVARLIEVCEGGEYQGSVKGVSPVDAAAFISKSTVAVFADPFPKERGVLPERPKVRRSSSITPFRGTVVESSPTPGGSHYVSVTLFPESGDQNADPTEIIDCEFLFLKGDNIVNVRATSRQQPESEGLNKGQLSFGNVSGLTLDKNLARRKVESLRKALGWNIVTVVSDFDPAFNPEVPVFVERIFQPFSEAKNSFRPSGIPYPSD